MPGVAFPGEDAGIHVSLLFAQCPFDAQRAEAAFEAGSFALQLSAQLIGSFVSHEHQMAVVMWDLARELRERQMGA